MLDAPVLDALADIELPVLVTFGTEDALIPNRIVHGRDTVALARQAVARLPDAQLVLVRDAGHMVQLERPDEWNAAVLTYLSRRVGW
jgi:pimeloyl-ACP methyl ester carboxylesterase